MTWNILDTFTTVPGVISFASTEVSANRNWLVYAPDIDESDVQSYGVLVLQIFNFDIGGEYMSIFSHNCYTRVEAVFNPVPMMGTLNLRTCFYPGERTKSRSVQVWTET